MEKNSVKKIAVIGAESTGKSNLCESLAQHYNTVFVPEYARTYFNTNNIHNYSILDLEIIARKQIDLENELIKKANALLFCDTTLLTLKIWGDLEFNKSIPFVENNLPVINYDYYLIANNDVPWEPDIQRQNKFSRDLIFNLNLNYTKQQNVPYFVVNGNNQARLENAVNYINSIL